MTKDEEEILRNSLVNGVYTEESRRIFRKCMVTIFYPPELNCVFHRPHSIRCKPTIEMGKLIWEF